MTTFLITAQSLGRYDSFFLTHNTRFQNFLTIIIDKLRSFCFLADHVKVCKLLMRPKFQKRSALKFDGRIILEAKPSGIKEQFVYEKNTLFSILNGDIFNSYFLWRKTYFDKPGAV